MLEGCDGMIPETMRAVVLTEPTPAEAVRLTTCPVPQVCPGWVLVRVKAFGMNHSEQILRLSETAVMPNMRCFRPITSFTLPPAFRGLSWPLCRRHTSPLGVRCLKG